MKSHKDLDENYKTKRQWHEEDRSGLDFGVLPCRRKSHGEKQSGKLNRAQ